jgi:hypothetical protein
MYRLGSGLDCSCTTAVENTMLNSLGTLVLSDFPTPSPHNPISSHLLSLDQTTSPTIAIGRMAPLYASVFRRRHKIPTSRTGPVFAAVEHAVG